MTETVLIVTYSLLTVIGQVPPPFIRLDRGGLCDQAAVSIRSKTRIIRRELTCVREEKNNNASIIFIIGNLNMTRC